MNRKIKILIAFVVYLVGMIGMMVCVDNYIIKKEYKLQCEIESELDNLFHGKERMVDLAYSNVPIHYEQTTIPKLSDVLDPLTSIVYSEKEIKDKEKQFEDKYSDLKCLYQLDYGNSYDLGLQYNNGWSLYVIENNRQSARVQIMFPYAVGFKNNKNYSNTSVPEAVRDAFNFYINNKNSYLFNNFEEGGYKRFLKKVREIKNDYYYIGANTDAAEISILFDPLFEKKPHNQKIQCYQNGFMYNSRYKVYVALTPPIDYEIKEYPFVVKREQYILYIVFSVLLTVILLLIIFPLMRKELKMRRILKEDLYQKLIRVCNPTNFIDKYDKEKVDKANVIYQKLMNTSPDDKETLLELLSQAEQGLDVSFVDAEKVNELKEKVNPKNFIKPYNAEKVALANELYYILSKEGITYNDLVEVEEKLNKL